VDVDHVAGDARLKQVSKASNRRIGLHAVSGHQWHSGVSTRRDESPGAVQRRLQRLLA